MVNRRKTAECFLASIFLKIPFINMVGCNTIESHNGQSGDILPKMETPIGNRYKHNFYIFGSYLLNSSERSVKVPKYSKQSLQFPLPFLEIHSTQRNRSAPMKRLIQSVISIHRSNLRKRLRTLGIGTITSPFSRNRWSVVSLNPILLIHLDVLQSVE